MVELNLNERMIKLKKVLLCGATHGSNFGDSLFAYMFKKSIKIKSKDIEVKFTRVSEYSKQELGIRSATVKDLFSTDAMIYISGGYFGESHNESFKGSVYRFLIYYIYGLLMLIRKKPIAILGVGAGPLKRGFLRRTVVYIFNKAKLVSVRDKMSREYMKNYGVNKHIAVTSDSAQAIDNEIYAVRKSESSLINNIKIRNRRKVMIHITGVTGNDIYYKYVIKAIQETLCLNDNNGYIVTADSIINNDYLNKVYNALPKDRTIIYNYRNPLDFLGIIDSVDAIITPKLHVGILGCTYGKPVLSFPVHPGKTERYYQQIGYPKHCKSLYNLSKEEAKDIINQYIWEEIKLPDSIRNNAQKNFDLLNDFIDKYILEC